MNINLQTKIANLLETYPQLENKLIELSPIFSRLRNPVLRRTIAKVTSLKQAAEVAGISPPVLVMELRKAVGLTPESVDIVTSNSPTAQIPPVWFNESKVSVCYDVRPVIDAGESPMHEILKLSAQLKPGEILQLISSFKPSPILDLLDSKGFKSWSIGEKYFIAKIAGV